MSESANVRSVAALKDFKVAMIAFAEDAKSALGSVDMEVRRTRGWLERDQIAYWKSQVKRRQEELAMARADLHRKKLSASKSDAISDSDQKEAVRVAERKLVEAEQKVEKVKKWIPILEQAASEYNSQSQPLGDRLTGAWENSLAAIERMVGSLEAYLAIAPPAAASFSSGAATTSSAPASESPSFSFAAGGESAPAGSDKSTEAAATAEPKPAPPSAEDGAGTAAEPGPSREPA